MRSLKEIDELAGKNNSLPKWEDASERERFAINVRRIYRPARAVIFQPEKRDEALLGMLAYAEAQQKLNISADHEPKVFAALIFNTRACAAGFSDKESQCILNAEGMKILLEIPEEERTEDWGYVRSKIFFGLLENCDEFLESVSVDDWKREVDELEEHQSPNFPGRALILARRLIDEGNQRDALHLLERASLAGYGKNDQLNDVQEFMRSLAII